MKDYIFVLGRDPEISLEEIKRYLESRRYDFKIKEYNKKIALVSVDHLKNKIIGDLGGTLKIAEVFNIKDLDINQDEIKYGFSVYGSKGITKIKNELKNYFKKQKTKVIIKNPKMGETFSPSEFKGNFIEFVVYNNYLAKTILVSNPKDYGNRDDKKPYFDRLKVTSIRLTKILINLSGVKENETLLDPFCGTGTILQEALLMGINGYGIEKDHRTFEGCKTNLNWFKKAFNVKNNFEVFHGDAREATKFIDKVDVVVTEPFLGPFFKQYPSETQAMKIKNELTRLYFDTLRELKGMTKKRIIFISPIIPFKKGHAKPDMESILSKLRIKVEKKFLYQVQGNIIDREIYVLTP
ncbi:MAG: DNA methyltransferase [Candidatus Nanoarchaeia archaeon]|nr:DNA methyltransferase [Candidatus Nanoarchaeia archaeon]